VRAPGQEAQACGGLFHDFGLGQDTAPGSRDDCIGRDDEGVAQVLPFASGPTRHLCLGAGEALDQFARRFGACRRFVHVGRK
jgi:hypothetical protein